MCKANIVSKLKLLSEEVREFEQTLGEAVKAPDRANIQFKGSDLFHVTEIMHCCSR